MGQEAGAEIYNELHAQEEPNVSVERSFYYPLYSEVIRQISELRLESVLEVGCGTGSLAELIMNRTSVKYRGFDFSAVGVERAVRRTGQLDIFFLGNALDPASYRYPYAAIVCTEVLEHITLDLKAISLWRPGAKCICSVPNFDYSTHVRHFRHEDDIRSRYGDLIDIESIVRVPKPVLAGNTLRDYFRRVRWARNEPRKMLGLLGMNTFDWYAGWFLFSGSRRN